MIFQQILNKDSGLSTRAKLNSMLSALIQSDEGVNAVWVFLKSLEQAMQTLSSKEDNDVADLRGSLAGANDYTDKAVNKLYTYVDAMNGGVGGLIDSTSYDPSGLPTDKPCTLIALGSGTFTNLKDVNNTAITVSQSNSITVFFRAAHITYWNYKTEVLTAPPMDATPTDGNTTHVVSSDGVYDFVMAHGIDDVDVADTTGSDYFKDRIVFTMRKNMGTVSEPEYETIAAFTIPVATATKAGLMPAYVDGVFDVNRYVGSNTPYDSLSQVLNNAATLIPTAVRRGGMSIKFIQSSDNKYVQYRLKATSFSTNEEDWQCEDAIDVIRGENDKVSIVDKNNYAILRLLSYLLVDKNGNIITKGFNSAEQAIIGNALAVLSEKFANTFPGGTPSNFSVEDENQNVILKLLSYLLVDDTGNIQTKNFDSTKLKVVSNNADSLSVEDLAGNSIVSINKAGHLKTKTFDSSKVIIVDINGKGDYTSLEDAINNAGDSYLQGIDKTIIVMPGTYHMTQIANDETAVSFGNRSLNIIGVSREKCIIYGDNGYYTNQYVEGSPGFRDSAPLKLAGNCYIANLTIIATDDNFQMDPADTSDPETRHGGYCIHIDYYNQGPWTFHVDNCILKNDHCACIGCGLRGKLIVTNCIMEHTMYNTSPSAIRGCVYAHDSGAIDVPGPYDEVEVLVKDCILTGHSGYALTFYAVYHKTMHLTFINNVVFNEAGGDVLLYDTAYQDKTKYCFGNNNSELDYNV